MNYVIPTGLNQIEDPYQIEDLLASNGAQLIQANYDLLNGQARDLLATTVQTINSQIGFQANEGAMLDQSYLFVQYDITFTDDAAGVGYLTGTIFPMLTEKMFTNFNIQTNSFSSNINTNIPGRTIALWSLLNKLQYYSPNDMAINAEIEKLQVVPGNNINTVTIAGTPTQILDNSGGYIWNNGIQVYYPKPAGSLSKTVTIYQKVPIKSILPLAERIHLLSGTVNFTFSLNYIQNLLASPTLVENTGNGSYISGFKMSRFQFYVDKLMFSRPDPTLDIRRLKSIDVKIQTATADYIINVPGTGPFPAGTLTTRCNFTLQAISGSIFKCIVAPYVKSVNNMDPTLVTETGYFQDNYKLSNYIITPQTTAVGSYTLTGNNILKCLGAMWNIYDAKIDIGGIVVPEPNGLILTNGPEASAVQYIQSFVKNLGVRTDGGSSRSCFPLSLWSDYLKVLIVDLENATKFNPNNINLTVSFSICNAYDLSAPGPGSIAFSFDTFTTHVVEYANL